MSKVVTLKDKSFKIYIQEPVIQEAIAKVGAKISEDLKNEQPIFICVLNGSFLFAADLMKNVSIPCHISFIKLASYHGGTQSSGSVNELIGLYENIEGRTVVILEDIVDTGNTLEKLHAILKPKNPGKLLIASLLYKPEAYKKQIPIDYVGMEVPNNFLVGFGLDYDGLGRNLRDIYTLID
jgi:hypoxanthine phosphoribosyltransferase